MSVAATWTLRCDRIVAPGGITCGAQFIAHVVNPAAARRAAATEGWTRSTGGTDACPTHSRGTA